MSHVHLNLDAREGFDEEAFACREVWDELVGDDQSDFDLQDVERLEEVLEYEDLSWIA